MSTAISVIVPGSAVGSTNIWVRAVLKVYDRRFAAGLRKNECSEPLTPEVDKAFTAFICSDEAVAFARWWCEDFEGEDMSAFANEDWTDVQDELHLHLKCVENWENELKAYRHLKELQGRQIPTLYGAATVVCQDPMPITSLPHAAEIFPHGSLSSVPALLMEHIHGPTFDDMVAEVPRHCWKLLVDESRAVVRAYEQIGFCNHDVRPRNFIASPCPIVGWANPRAVMLDLALSEIRDKETDEEWGLRKHQEDEECCMCVYMQRYLREAGFEYEFERPETWWAFAEKETSADRRKRPTGPGSERSDQEAATGREDGEESTQAGLTNVASAIISESGTETVDGEPKTKLMDCKNEEKAEA
jgi:hypothetical protein